MTHSIYLPDVCVCVCVFLYVLGQWENKNVCGFNFCTKKKWKCMRGTCISMTLSLSLPISLGGLTWSSTYIVTRLWMLKIVYIGEYTPICVRVCMCVCVCVTVNCTGLDSSSRSPSMRQVSFFLCLACSPSWIPNVSIVRSFIHSSLSSFVTIAPSVNSINSFFFFWLKA